MDKTDWKFLFLEYEGRINRAKWWLGVAVLFVVSLVTAVLFGQGLIGMIIALALIYPSLCLHIKRCHDRNQTGWWCLIMLIPVVNLIWAVINLGILEGTRGENRFGPDPLAGL